ncbi:MAG: tetratricopeptide repeat protein [Chitinophagaceae bacterium]|nr:MAG: tetratricopeptide repeat protein [Chitinophagaceae bacterium]
MRKVLFPVLLALCCLPVSGFCQKKIDSLHAVLQRSLPDSQRAQALYGLVREHVAARRYDSGIFNARKVIALPNRPPVYKYKVKAANQMGICYYLKADYPAAAAAFRDMYQWAERDRDRKNMAIALNNEGNIYIETGETSIALERYRSSLVIREALRDSFEIAMAYNNIGFVYKDIGDYEKAVGYFLSALKIYEALNRPQVIAMSYNNLGMVFFRKKDYPQTIEYHAKALDIQRRINDRDGMGISLLGSVSAFTEMGEYAKALPYAQEALRIYTELKDGRQLAQTNKTIGDLYFKQDRFAESLPYFQAALQFDQHSGNKRSLPTSYITTALAFVRLRDLIHARPLIDSATVLVQASGNAQDRKSLLEVEAEYHQRKGDYERALEFAQEWAKQKDALLNEANVKSLNDLKVRYETARKEAAIALLQKDNAIQALQIRNQRLELAEQLYQLSQNELALSRADLLLARNQLLLEGQRKNILQQRFDSTQRVRDIRDLRKQTEVQGLEIRNRQLQLSRRNTIIGGMAATLLLVALLGYSFYRRRQLAAEARLQATILQQQELATKAILEAEEGERQRIAKDLHDGVGQMMSAAKMNLSALAHRLQLQQPEQAADYDRIISLVDESCREVRTVSHNMMPNALLKNSLGAAVREFIDKIDHKALQVHLYTEGLDERLDGNIETVLYRVIQECVNNVIKHSGAHTLDIAIVRDDTELTATVEDNGRGFDTALAADGIGLRNIRTRVEYLKGAVEFDSQPGRGTVVSIHVPLQRTLKQPVHT